MDKQTVALFAGTLRLAYRDQGSGRPFLLLHGGAGPGSMGAFAAAIAESGRAIVPVYPGFDGEPRPEWFHRMSDLALAHLALIEQLDLFDVVVIGNSVGGWLAAELGLRASQRIARLVLLDAVGLDPTADGGGIVDPAALLPGELPTYSFHDPSRLRPPADAAAAAMMAANQQALRVYAGAPFMHDPALRGRLAGLKVPTLVLWGASDRIVTPAYGRQFAELIPGARFAVLEEAGHLPQIEQPQQVLAMINGGP